MFFNSKSYHISNYTSDKKGLVGLENEFFLDLESSLSDELVGAFDVVFNHTTLEHIYDFRLAMHNLARMSRNVVITVVPYLQQLHGSGYSDYWRFTPYALDRMFKEEGMVLRYCSANGGDRASIYLFAIALHEPTSHPEIPDRFDVALDPTKPLYGRRARNVIGGRIVG